jgi:hypothetical protein
MLHNSRDRIFRGLIPPVLFMFIFLSPSAWRPSFGFLVRGLAGVLTRQRGGK